jgi:hypothetical protein
MNPVILSNGAEVLAIDFSKGVVLAKNHNGKFVTWRTRRNDSGAYDCDSGHYFNHDKERDARADFASLCSR